MDQIQSTHPTVIEVPEWVIHLHDYRKRLFLKIVEPVIVFILGPLADEVDQQSQDQLPHSIHYNDHVHQRHLYQPSDMIPNAAAYSPYTLPYRRRLGFLPNYVEDVSAFRETSMSFATLTMLFTIMTCLFIVFLSCFYHNQKTSPLFISPRRNRLPRLVPPPLPVDGIFSWVSSFSTIKN